MTPMTEGRRGVRPSLRRRGAKRGGSDPVEQRQLVSGAPPLDEVVELDDRQQHRQHDHDHDAAHADDQQRLEQRRHRDARRCTSAESCLAPRSSIMGAARSARPGRDIASMPGKPFLPAIAEARGRLHAPAPALSFCIGAHRVVRAGSDASCTPSGWHAGAGEHRQRTGEARRVVAAREAPDQRHVEQGGVETRRNAAWRRPRNRRPPTTSNRPPTSREPQLARERS